MLQAFDFMGQCEYTLVETSNFTIQAENTPCNGAISQEQLIFFNHILGGSFVYVSGPVKKQSDQTWRILALSGWIRIGNENNWISRMKIADQDLKNWIQE